MLFLFLAKMTVPIFLTPCYSECIKEKGASLWLTSLVLLHTVTLALPIFLVRLISVWLIALVRKVRKLSLTYCILPAARPGCGFF